jgi:hypothetical protein
MAPHRRRAGATASLVNLIASKQTGRAQDVADVQVLTALQRLIDARHE